MADVLLDDVSRIFPDGSTAVSHLTLHVRNGELLVIVGPSGCGKSSVLRLIAGLDPLGGGTVSIGGRVVNHLTPGERNLAMVFEAAALYPHLTAAQNLRFGLTLRKLPDDEISQRVEAGDQAQDRALAAAAGADDHQQLAVADVQGQVRDGRAAVGEHPGDIIEQDVGHAAATTTRPVP